MPATPSSEIDHQLTTPEFFADPYPTYQQLREDHPVFWSESQGAWLISRYDDVKSTLRSHAEFSSRGRFSGVMAHLSEEEKCRFQPLQSHFSVGMIGSDPPEHTRLRGLINRAFTPRVIASLQEPVTSLVDGFLDEVERRGTGEMDIVADLAHPLPATVIAELIGAPFESREQFKVWSDGILAFQGTGRTTPEVLERSQSDLTEMRAFISDLVEQRRKVPADDLLSRMVEVEAEGDMLTEAELLTTCVTLLTAGHETTTSLIGNGMLTLLRHPEEMARLWDNRDLMPTAIEEMLRYESPLQRNPRKLASDVELHGAQMRDGDFVLQLLGSANRDEVQFEQPQHFDITRKPNRHLSFGFGIHFCLGAPLARLEAPIAIGAMLDRMPSMQLAEDPRWIEHGLLRGLRSLRVSYGR